MGDLAKRTRLFELNREKSDIVSEVEERILSGRVQAAWESRRHGLEYVLNEAAFFEMSRLEGSRTKRHMAQYEFWHDLALTVGRNAEDENADLLASLVRQYAQDIIGQLNPAVFRLATRVVPVGLNLLFNAQSFSGVVSEFQRLSDRILVRGELETLHALSRVGSLLYLPTHSSHMDSILMGWALDNVGLPPVTYGAGKNLFRRPLMRFFLSNLGAYKVDRRLKHDLYKEVLKTISSIFLERGFHSLFFPGGTRSRDGQVESHLKLGLMGTALSAFTQTAIDDRRQPVFIVPVTINYHLILEGQTLIGDYLRTDGQSRFIIEDDEFSDAARVSRFALNTMAMQNPLVMYFAEPMDCFGNRVDASGQSYDQCGRPVDPLRYVLGDDGPYHDEVRDREYVRHLGTCVAASLRRNNFVFSIHLVALAIFEVMRFRHARWDLYNTIRFGRGEFISFEELGAWCERVLEAARDAAAKERVRLGPQVERASAQKVVDEACKYFTLYHTTPLIVRRGDGIELNDMALLYYYSNRARGYDIEKSVRGQG
jgi:glycerol-3-phosphate O-acyltransferase